MANSRERKIDRGALVDSFRGLSELETFWAEEDIRDLESKTGLEYDECPVNMETFLLDPYYLGYHGRDIWPTLVDNLIELFEEGPYDTVILTGGIGWGKDFFTSFAICRMIYEVSCFRDPATAYGLAHDSSVVFKNFSINATKARKVLFSEIATKVKRSPYFNERFGYDRSVLSELRFPKNVRAEPGNSLETSALGENIFGAAMDEANFMPVVLDSKQVGVQGRYDPAQRLFDAARRRMKSRFKDMGPRPGMMIVLSSKQYPDDFTERKIRELGDDPKTFILDYPEWGTRRKDDYCGTTFRIEVNNEHGECRMLEEDESEESITGELVEVPVEWKPEFERNIEGAVRDIAGRSTLAISPFIMNRAKIYDAVVEDWAHPFSAEETTLEDGARLLREEIAEKDDKGIWHPKLNPGAVRAIHLDPGLTGDAFGFCMGHIESYVMVQRAVSVEDVDETGRGKPRVQIFTERLPVINFDLILRIVPPRGGEIQFNDVRSLIYELSNLGFKIRIVTMDSFETVEMKQIMEKKGYIVDNLSIDADMAPYNRAKNALADDRVRMYWYDRLLEELKRLERRFKGTKEYVDHPASFSKDVADAFAGVIYNLETMEIQPVIAPSLGMMEGDDPARKSRISKEEYRWLYGKEPPPKPGDDEDEEEEEEEEEQGGGEDWGWGEEE